MSDAFALAREIEPASYRSWKARECVVHDGWELRYADGFSRRGNSVFPAAISTQPIVEKLEWCRQWYSERDLDLVFRQTVTTEPGLDDELGHLGFTLEGRTNIMVGIAEAGAADVEIFDAPTPEWWSTIASLWGFDLSNPHGWAAIINRIDRPAGFAVVDGRAAGLAIVDDGWVGLFEIIVAPDERRSGLGSSMTRALVDWGRSNGADRSYLQVVAENSTAISFYETLGFEFAYDYWYRRDQVRSAKSPA